MASMRAQFEFVLVKPSHPGNIGAAARAVAVMGFTRLCVVDPRFENAHQHEEAIAFASGATELLARTRVCATLDEALSSCRWVVGFTATGREFAAQVVGPRQMADEVVRELADHGRWSDSGVVDQAGPPEHATIAIVFGTERTGLSISEAQRCDRLCSIDTAPDYSSLNLAQAVQLAAFVLREAVSAPSSSGRGLYGRASADGAGGGGQAALPVEPGDLPATQRQLAGLFEHLEATLIAIGFLDPQRPKRLMPRLRRLARRARLSTAEVDIARGVCSQILSHHKKRRS